jgi:tRNA threonylcarbamoyladenosine biosynthesis protein TsaE
MAVVIFVISLLRSIVPILREGELDIISNNPDQTRRLGIRLGKLLQAGDIICLSGDMGAGKTVFSSGIGMGWGADTPLTSPTYNLVHEHRHPTNPEPLYHLDCYRLSGAEEADTIGLDDILDGNGIVIFEWAERIEDMLPDEYLWVDIRVMDEDRRNFIMEANGKRYHELIDTYKKHVFGTR